MNVFISDCEGPISKNDNAFEITSQFVPNGDKLFRVISGYDDALADLIKRPGHRAGSTLKLVLPFLIANGITDRTMSEFCSRNLVLMPHAKLTLQEVRAIAQAFVVSTSYEHYIKAVCRALHFPFENAYCTRLELDNYSVSRQEKNRLNEIAREIASMPQMEIPPKAKRVEDLPADYECLINRLDKLFHEIRDMECGMVYSVKPIGGIEKAEAVRDVVERLNVGLHEVMYVGDSITDEEAFKLVRSEGGLTVSFNGNPYAVKNAEIAVLSLTTLVTAIILHVFVHHGKEGVFELVQDWDMKDLKESVIYGSLPKKLFKLKEQPKVRIITPENKSSLAEESAAFRKLVRGEKVGGLG